MLSRMEPTGGVLPTEQLSVRRVMPKDLLPVWLQLLPQIKHGLKRGAADTLTENGLYTGIAHGELILWVMCHGPEILAAFFLQIEVRPRGRALVVLNVVSGPSGKYPHQYNDEMLLRLREYGDMIGVYTIESVSRLGAARRLMRHGCKPKAMIMELRDGRKHT